MTISFDILLFTVLSQLYKLFLYKLLIFTIHIAVIVYNIWVLLYIFILLYILYNID